MQEYDSLLIGGSAFSGSDEFFFREYRLSIATTSGERITLGERNKTDNMATHIQFKASKSQSTINRVSIAIWNLNKAQEKILMSNGAVFELRAGYNKNLNLVCQGGITRVVRSRDGADIKYSIEGIILVSKQEDMYVSVSVSTTTTVYDCINMICGMIRMPDKSVLFTQKAAALAQACVRKSYSFIGRFEDCMNELCAVSGLLWYIRNGALSVCADKNDSPTNIIYNMDSKHGLIDIPARIYNSALATGCSGNALYDSMIGYRIKYFMNTAIDIGDVINLSSSEANGKYMVYKIEVSGDNAKGDWVCVADIVEETQAYPIRANVINGGA